MKILLNPNFNPDLTPAVLALQYKTRWDELVDQVLGPGLLSPYDPDVAYGMVVLEEFVGRKFIHHVGTIHPTALFEFARAFPGAIERIMLGCRAGNKCMSEAILQIVGYLIDELASRIDSNFERYNTQVSEFFTMMEFEEPVREAVLMAIHARFITTPDPSVKLRGWARGAEPRQQPSISPLQETTMRHIITTSSTVVLFTTLHEQLGNIPARHVDDVEPTVRSAPGLIEILDSRQQVRVRAREVPDPAVLEPALAWKIEAHEDNFA